MKLQEKVAVITGAGSGMGREMAKLFAAEGAKVVAADIVPAGVEEVVSEIRAAGGTATAVVANVAKAEDVEAMIDTAMGTYGRLDILVNNAGIMDRVMPVADCSDELWNRVMAVNLNGPFYACRKAIPIMQKQGGGSIINTASVAGLRGGAAGVAYTSSKHAVLGLTKNIAGFYAKDGIRCNAICPGGVATAIGIGGQPHGEGIERLMKVSQLSPRVAEAREIATVALFLASSDASFVNGVALVADGGWVAI
ncbi:MAG: short-chain dehydrogenase/reductase [Symbiobacteriaceae bacterium]|jgi:NAD(P)-dependent dehydrogenase (short-subunit alcohol dehydrogenase family)|nr:short-chain dehydrogenase/reductase [Symbiobacteriaceae bacterium]